MNHASFAPLSLLVLASLALHAAPAASATLTNLGHNIGAQCRATGVNDLGTAAGTCVPGTNNGAPIPWMMVRNLQTGLAGLSAGISCSVLGIANNGTVVGSCLDQTSVPFGVVWSGPSIVPLKLAPLAGLLGIDAHVRTIPKAFNQSGYVAGQSVAFDGSSTASLWSPGSGTALLVSASSDNCQVAAINDTVGGALPSILLNCPAPNGQSIAKVATPTGALRTYDLRPLAIAPGSAYCVAAGLNSAGQVVGSCIYPSSPFSQTAIWASATATPSLMVLPNFAGDVIGKRNGGVFINSAGHIVFSYQTDDGKDGVGYLDSLSNMPVLLPPIVTGASLTATGFADNDRIIVVGDNATGNRQSAVFDPSSGMIAPIAQLPGGTNSELKTISRLGGYAAGVAQDAGHNDNAVLTMLP